jgi:hypothetical protein
MKNTILSILTLMMVVFTITSCEKVDDLKINGDGTAAVLSSSTQTLAAQAADSSSQLVTFSWTYPNYATDSSNHKYILQFDSAGRNFSKLISRVVLGNLTSSFTAKEMNEIMLGLGFKFNQTYNMEVRVISSYANNNQQLTSNVLTLSATPYKVPPKVVLPFSNHLYIIGGATDFGWNQENPMPPIRELTRLDETTWAGIYHLNGGSGYLLLPQPNWDNKYAIQDNSVPGAANGGTFGYNFPQDFPGNVAQGDSWYKMVFDFQTGRYTITQEEFPMGQQLFITGDATPESWTNSPSSAQRMDMITNGVFEITMSLQPGKLYKFLNTNGQWQPQFGGSSATGGNLEANYGSAGDPPAIPTPSVAGNYKIQVNFINKTYSVTLQP